MEETVNHFPVKVPAKSLTVLVFWLLCSANLTFVQAGIHGAGEQALAKIDIYKTTLALDGSAVITAYPRTLGSLGEDSEWITVNIVNEKPSADDWVGVFSPANFNASTCPPQDEQWQETPYICTAPIKVCTKVIIDIELRLIVESGESKTSLTSSVTLDVLVPVQVCEP